MQTGDTSQIALICIAALDKHQHSTSPSGHPQSAVLTLHPEILHIGLKRNVFQSYAEGGQQQDAHKQNLAGMALHQPSRVEQVALCVGAHPQRRPVPLGVTLQQRGRGQGRSGEAGEGDTTASRGVVLVGEQHVSQQKSDHRTIPEFFVWLLVV